MQDRSSPSDRKRYKAIMKQVVGLPFSTLPDGGEERDIIKVVVEASGSPPLSSQTAKELEATAPPSYPSENEAEEHDAMLESILGKLKVVLGARLRVYLQSITEKLLDQGTEITWNSSANTCQHFCTSILDHTLFQPLVGGPPTPGSKSPLYAMSFVCQDEGYHQRIVRTKHDVAPGLTEEYLGNMYFKNHAQSDLIDVNQEYWYDWAGLDKPECGHAEYFPFDCTRAYTGSKDVSRDCGDCSLSRHLWAFPFDSWGMVSMHLAREPTDYPQPQHAWFTNRLAILHAQSVLCRAAAAMASSPALQAATAWMHSGSALAREPSLARIRMGGIHRAQPMSHYFEKGANELYFLAAWAPMRNRSAEYRAARKERVAASDLPANSQDRFAKASAKNASGSKGQPDTYVGFAGLNVSQRGTPASKNMFKTKRGQALIAAGIWQTPVINENGDRIRGACMDSAACGSKCGNSSCGGPACGSVPSQCTGAGYRMSSNCGGAGFSFGFG